MSWEHIDINMTPGGEMPIVHVSQFDTYRAFTFNLYVGEDEWAIPEGIRFELHCRKVDDNIVIIEPDSTDAASVTFITTEQLTACAGKNKCELVAIDTDDDSLIVGSINFILDVEADPLAGGLTSETSISNLTQQIEDIAEQVIGEDYYDKTEVDALLADKADVSDLPDMTQYYTKTQTDTLLNGKADASTTYTKTEVDNALALKANSADLATVAITGDYDDLINKPTIPAAQIQSDYAQADNTQVDYIKNKPDIEGMIAAALLAVMPVETQTGNPCSFNTDIAAELHELTADIVASGGGGTPSTPIPIVGYTELNLTHNGITDTIALGSTVYGGVLDVTRGKLSVTWGIVDLGEQTWVKVGMGGGRYGFRTSLADMIPTPASNVLISAICSNYITFTGNDVYLGNIGISGWGEGTQDIAIYDTAYESADATAFKTAMSGVYLAYELATPIEIDVSELSVSAIVGTNNITSDVGGDVTASYKVSIQKYIDDNV